MPRDSKVYIFVPFKDRDEAKELGAKWDKDKKQWFVPSGLDFAKFAKWEQQYTYEINRNEALRQFSEKLRECGLLLESLPIMDGKIHRCKVEGDRGREASGAYQGYLDGYPNGWIHNFKTDERVKFKYAMTASYNTIATTYNKDKASEQRKANAQAKERYQQELQEKTTKRLKIEFANALPAPRSHPYLESKNINIQNINIKVDTFNNLLIPLRDVNGKMQSLQRIMPNGSKIYGVIKTEQEKQNNEEFLARKKGLFFTQRPLDEHSEFFVCEGFASAMSMSEILGKPSIAAMDCGNLLNVCDELVSKYPHKRITICADNDMKKELQGKRNAGIEAAQSCQEKYPQIRIIYPQIQPSEMEKVSDFNDSVKLRGIETVRAEVKRQIAITQNTLKSIATPKQKTIDKVDSYANTQEFKALSKDKQEAILSLKDIEPSPMPQGISIKDLEHLQVHFSDKLDKEQREKFLTLFNDTKDNPHIVLEVLKNGEIRQEYIKAYQHKESKDLYYLAITKDEKDITGIPTTKLIKVINDIAKSREILKAVNLERISNTAAPLQKQTSSQRSSDIIPQIHKKDDFER